MKREIDMKEISDGKLYGPNDLVKADCGDCHGCFDCCRGMGQSILLDPLDIYRLTGNLKVTFEELLAEAYQASCSGSYVNGSCYNICQRSRKQDYFYKGL